MLGWLVLACSGGPGVVDQMDAAEHTGHVAAAVAAGVLVAAAIALCVRARRVRKTAVALALASVLHPGLWFGARHGDCGHLVNDTAWPATAIAIVLAAAALVATELRSRRDR